MVNWYKAMQAWILDHNLTHYILNTPSLFGETSFDGLLTNVGESKNEEAQHKEGRTNHCQARKLVRWHHRHPRDAILGVKPDPRRMSPKNVLSHLHQSPFKIAYMPYNLRLRAFQFLSMLVVMSWRTQIISQVRKAPSPQRCFEDLRCMCCIHCFSTTVERIDGKGIVEIFIA